MPLYEEKLINPLALRYTQEHIRTTFRDKRPVEPTIREIQVTPGDGKEYDVILHAPFPHIEIVRWSPPANGHLHLSLDDDSEEEDDQFDEACSEDGAREHHWFTLDNRRLYCLQRAAVALLPKRAAAVVEILYADPGAVRRKYDSESQGLAVSMSQSTKCAPLFKWFWRDQVLPPACATVSQLHLAHEAFAELLKDDARRTVDNLLDVPRQPSSASAAASSSSRPSAPAACSTGRSAVERQGAGGRIAVSGGIDEEAADRLARFAEAAAAEDEDRQLLAHAVHAAELMAAPAAAGRPAGSRAQHALAPGHHCPHGHQGQQGHHGHCQHGGTKSGQATPSTTDGCQSEAGSVEVSPRTSGMPLVTSAEGSCDAEAGAMEPHFEDMEDEHWWEAPEDVSPSGWWKNEKAAIGGAKSNWRHTLDALRTQLEGFHWTGRRGDTYELSYAGEATWCCLRRDASGTKKFTVSYDWEWNLIWWGTDQAYYSDAADFLAAGAEEVRWYAAADWNKHKVRFAWSRWPAKSWESDQAAEVKAVRMRLKGASEEFAGRRGKHGTRSSAW